MRDDEYVSQVSLLHLKKEDDIKKAHMCELISNLPSKNTSKLNNVVNNNGTFELSHASWWLRCGDI